jgi:hypothetical protein
MTKSRRALLLPVSRMKQELVSSFKKLISYANQHEIPSKKTDIFKISVPVLFLPHENTQSPHQAR